MKNTKYIVGLLLVAGFAFALQEVKYDKFNSPKAQWFPKGVIINEDKLADARGNPPLDNKVLDVICRTLDYQFAAIPPNYNQKSFSKSFVATGSVMGDPCFIGVNGASPPDAGSAKLDILDYYCDVRTNNTVEIYASNNGGDGGTATPPDAGYQVCIFHTAKVIYLLDGGTANGAALDGGPNNGF